MNRIVLLNQDLTAGDVFVTPDADRPRSRKSSAGEPTWSLPILLRRVGELLVVNRLSRGRGLLVHALGIDDGGRGFLFVGPSGSGKTTLANLYRDCPGVTILSDERAIVSRIGLDFFVSGTPWPGGAMTVSAGSAPLREIFFLEHAGSNLLHPEPPSRLAALLCQQLFLPFWDPPGLTGALRFVDEVIRAIPARRLGFVNDARVIEFLREQTGGSARPLPAGSPRSDGSPCLSR